MRHHSVADKRVSTTLSSKKSALRYREKSQQYAKETTSHHYDKEKKSQQYATETKSGKYDT